MRSPKLSASLRVEPRAERASPLPRIVAQGALIILIHIPGDWQCGEYGAPNGVLHARLRKPPQKRSQNKNRQWGHQDSLLLPFYFDKEPMSEPQPKQNRNHRGIQLRITRAQKLKQRQDRGHAHGHGQSTRDLAE